MRNENYLKAGVAATILILGVMISCSRNFAVPVSPTQITPTNTSTSTPKLTSTSTATNTGVNTATNTATVTSTNTPGNTATNTATQTATNTATNTSAITSTFTNTATLTTTNTATNTATLTPAITSTFTNTPTNTATATATVCGNPTWQVSDFQPAGSNIVNPCLTGVLTGSSGFFGVTPPSGAPVNGTLSSTIATGQGDAGLGDSYGVSVYSTWTDPATGVYPSVQEQCALYSGATYYSIPAGTTGIKYYLNINTQTSSGATAADFELQIGETYTVPTSGGGTCFSGCYNNFQQYPEGAGVVTGGWVLITETWATFATGYGEGALEGASPGTAFPCSTTVFNDGCNNTHVMTLQFMAGSHNTAGNYVSSFQLDNVTFY